MTQINKKGSDTDPADREYTLCVKDCVKKENLIQHRGLFPFFPLALPFKSQGILLV